MALNGNSDNDTMREPVRPSADGDPMGTPTSSEKVLWQGKPDHRTLARTAFHTRSVGIYFVALVALSLYLGNYNAALVCSVLGVMAVAILHSIAWFSARTTLYILTDTRLIMRIGMAIESRINVPLRHVQSAALKSRGNDHGDIVLKLGGERLLGYMLLWPHVRPWQINRPEPMLRAVPQAQHVAELLADACAAIVPIARPNGATNEAPHREPSTAKSPVTARAELTGATA